MSGQRTELGDYLSRVCMCIMTPLFRISYSLVTEVITVYLTWPLRDLAIGEDGRVDLARAHAHPIHGQVLVMFHRFIVVTLWFSRRVLPIDANAKNNLFQAEHGKEACRHDQFGDRIFRDILCWMIN